MRRAATTTLLCLLATTTAARADLSGDVRRALAEKAIAPATVGVQIVRLGDTRAQDQTLLSIDADRPLIPASNLKVITTALALETLGSDFRFQTQFVTNGRDVAIVGDGDPTFGDAEFLGPRGWTMFTVFDQWAEQLRLKGVTRVGDVLVDDSIFEEQTFHPDWPLNQAHRDYVAQVAGLNFNANCLDVYAIRNANGTASYRIEPDTSFVNVQEQLSVGSSHSLWLSRVLGTNDIVLKGTINGTNGVPFRVTIDDPGRFAASVLADTLRKHGIAVDGEVKRDRAVRASTTQPASTGSTAWTLVAVHETPIGPVVEETNKKSINLYAESLGKRAAAKASGQPGSWAGLGEAQRTFMQTVGAPEGDYVFGDGCGLSKENAVAPAAFCATLSHMFHAPGRAAYVASMSVGGVDGTLSRRFRDDLSGRVFGKSGYVNGVSTLTGYLHARDGNWYAFSVLANRVTNVSAAHKAQEAIVRAIDANAS